MNDPTEGVGPHGVPFVPRTTIEGLRGVGRVSLELEPGRSAYVMIGANGVGKTKVLEAFRLALFLSSDAVPNSPQYGRLQERGAVFSRFDCERFDIRMPKPAAPGQVIPITALRAGLSTHDRPFVLIGARGRGTITEDRPSVGGLGTFEERSKRHLDETFAALQRGDSGSGENDDVRRWFVLRAQSVNPYQSVADNRKSEIDTVLRLLNEVDSRIDGDALEIDGGGRVRLNVEGQPRELGELSSGFVSLLKLVQQIVAGYAAFSNEPRIDRIRGIVLIDELETHLHVRWQATMVGLLKRLLPNTVFFITTHSPLVIAQCDRGEAYRLEREVQGSVVARMLAAPRNSAFVDTLRDAFGVDVNRLKLDATTPESQQEVKAQLLELIPEELWP